MPELDLTPANTPEYLEDFCNYLKVNVEKYTGRGEVDKALHYSKILRMAQYESIASLIIRNAWLDVKLRKASQ